MIPGVPEYVLQEVLLVPVTRGKALEMVSTGYAFSRHHEEFAITGRHSDEQSEISTLLPSRTFGVRSCGAELDSLSKRRQ